MQLKVKFDKIKRYFLNERNSQLYFNMQNIQQCLDLFFIPNYECQFIDNNDDNDESENTDVVYYTDQQGDNTEMKDNVINVLVSVENMAKWDWLQHHAKYGNFGDNKINIYFYSHIDKIERGNGYIAIPMIHQYINYFKSNFYSIYPSNFTKFEDKKFCLVINRSKLNEEINNAVNILETMIGKVDNINLYDKEILNASCYFSIPLLNIFNKYKFILCFENSYGNGYVTEKIFNCFFAKTIPIYKGDPNVHKFINPLSFIDGTNITKNIGLIEMLMNDKQLYNKYIISNKIANIYNDENYKVELDKFIKNKLETLGKIKK